MTTQPVRLDIVSHIVPHCRMPQLICGMLASNYPRRVACDRVTLWPTSALVVNTKAAAGTRAKTVKGELVGDEASSASSRLDGGRHCILRDRNGNDIPISLPQDLGRNVRAGDKVEAQVDSAGRVLTISKDQ